MPKTGVSEHGEGRGVASPSRLNLAGPEAHDDRIEDEDVERAGSDDSEQHRPGNRSVWRGLLLAQRCRGVEPAEQEQPEQQGVKKVPFGVSAGVEDGERVALRGISDERDREDDEWCGGQGGEHELRP